jgi:hypothetical protein
MTSFFPYFCITQCLNIFLRPTHLKYIYIYILFPFFLHPHSTLVVELTPSASFSDLIVGN